jgi:hypothetical protein
MEMSNDGTNYTAAQESYMHLRREKRWMVLTLGTGWAIVLQTASFDEAKVRYLSLAVTMGSDQLLLVRVVDPWLGLYPVS